MKNPFLKNQYEELFGFSQFLGLTYATKFPSDQLTNQQQFKVDEFSLGPVRVGKNLPTHTIWNFMKSNVDGGPLNKGRDPFNQSSNRSDREKWSTSKGGPVFSKLFRLDRTDPLDFGPKFPEILVEWIAPKVRTLYRLVSRRFRSLVYMLRDWLFGNRPYSVRQIRSHG